MAPPSGFDIDMELLDPYGNQKAYSGNWGDSTESISFRATMSGNWRLTFTFEGEDAVLVDYQDYH